MTSARSPHAAPVLLLVMVTLVAGVLGGYAYRIAETGRAAAARQQQARDAARLRYQRSGEERDLLTRYTPEYRALADDGFIGNERRAGWIDSLRLANDVTGLSGVQYRIGAQMPYHLPQLPEAVLRQSPMTIGLQLLHEGDLMRFLHALAAGRAGVFTLNECTLERLGTEPAAHAQPNLRADCELAWISAPGPAEQAR
jgi:hypothetical protein